MLGELKKQVYEANMLLPKYGMVTFTWETSVGSTGRGIPCYGTTHADYLYGEIPCVRNLTKEEIEEAYEKLNRIRRGGHERWA